METRNGDSYEGTGMSGFSWVGQLFRSRRKARGLRIVEVARQAGLRDSAKPLRQIDELERKGLAPIDLVKTLCTFFGVELQAIREMWELDEEDRRRLRWDAAGGHPYFVVRWMPSVYQRKAVPAGLDRERLIKWAQTFVREELKDRRGCLVLSPEETVWFKEDGAHFISHDGFVPYTSVRGKRFMFAETKT